MKCANPRQDDLQVGEQGAQKEVFFSAPRYARRTASLLSRHHHKNPPPVTEGGFHRLIRKYRANIRNTRTEALKINYLISLSPLIFESTRLAHGATPCRRQDLDALDPSRRHVKKRSAKIDPGMLKPYPSNNVILDRRHVPSTNDQRSIAAHPRILRSL